ncbi:hypothetical protein EASAB2608_07361 [Streptomyces sp. EAS-AB2608]|uniref:Uncharacterized protein n=1 Tax=Streptomyces bangladeshensis TaxID=295352 RepID=A0ABP5N647_9ACTN|nr:hypothetical protein EASAB2608_07361 [Streptomyces sp. EAS-AB2608]
MQSGVEALTRSPVAPAEPAEAPLEPAEPFDAADAEPVEPVVSEVPVPLPAVGAAAAGDDATVAEVVGADDEVPSPSLWQAVSDRARTVPAAASSVER